MDLMIVELIYGLTIMPIVDIIYIWIKAMRLGITRTILDGIYDNCRWWRKLYYNVMKIRKAVMRSCMKINSTILRMLGKFLTRHGTK